MPAPAPHLVARFRADLEALTGTPAPRLGLAVSGGADSLAMLLLAAAARPGAVEAATVDHALRPQNADEAAAVAALCADLGVPHEILIVDVVPAGEGLQSAARHARYAALGMWTTRRRLPALLTAHHADDQAETVLMRLMRGSGVAGLAGVRAAGLVPHHDGETKLYRPVLGWRRADLHSIVAAAGLVPVQDPANTDERHDRARIRRHLAETPWLDPAALARSAAALAEAEDALARTADALFAARVRSDADGLVLTPADLLPELLRRLVLCCLQTLAPAAAPRGDQLTALIAQLARGETTTLAGIKCSAPGPYRFEPAPPRRRGPGAAPE